MRILVALIVIASAGAEWSSCSRNDQCDMENGEWCGSGCGPQGIEDCCISWEPCDVSTSSAHSCLSCSGEYGESYDITDDCFCLDPDLAIDDCYDGAGHPDGHGWDYGDASDTDDADARGKVAAGARGALVVLATALALL